MYRFIWHSKITISGLAPQYRLVLAFWTNNKCSKILFAHTSNTAVHENALKWAACEPQRDVQTYGLLDLILNWGSANDIRIRGHTIFWGREIYLQDWVEALSNPELFEEIRERVFDLLPRYQGQISEYDVNNEMLNLRYFRDRLGESIVDSMFTWAHSADPNAILYLNEYGILSANSVNDYVTMINALLARGLPVGGIGIQAHFFTANMDDGDDLFDACRIWNILDTLAQFDLPIKITEFDLSAPTDTTQARWLETLYKAAFAHPAVSGILMWGFWAGAHWRPNTAIFRTDFSPKPAATVYRNLVYDQWWTDTTAVTDSLGEVEIRSFYGRHLITATLGSVSNSKEVNFARGMPEPLEVIIQLPTVVPVELSLFTAQVEEDKVILTWITQTETNNFGFEVYKSFDGQDFEKIGFVKGQGTSTQKVTYTFEDFKYRSGTIFYRLKQIDTDGSFEFSQIISVKIDAPAEFLLSQNYPNPFNPETRIQYDLPKTTLVRLEIFNTLGQKIRTLIDELKAAGSYTVLWDGRMDFGEPAASGLYIYRLETTDFVKSRKLLLLR